MSASVWNFCEGKQIENGENIVKKEKNRKGRENTPRRDRRWESRRSLSRKMTCFEAGKLIREFAKKNASKQEIW